MSDGFLDMAEADLPAFFGEWGEEMTWTSSGAGTTVTGIFDDEYRTYIDNMVSGSAPQATFRASDVEGIAQGDTVTRTRTDTDYTVTEVMPDGAGLTVARLKKAS